MERGFLSKKGSGEGRGVKEKDPNDVPVAMEVQSPLVEQTNAVNTGGGSYPPLPTLGTTPAGNTPGKFSYANVIGELSKKAVNIRTLFTPGGNGIDVVVPVESIRAISERFVNTAYGFFLGKRVAYPVVKLHGVPVTAFSDDGLSAIATKLGTPLMLDSYTSDMCLQSWGRSSYARVMIKLRAAVELKDTIVVAMPKIMGERYYTCIVRVEYEWKPPMCLCCKVFSHTQEECPKNIGLGVAKNVKKPSQTSRGVSIGPKVGFKPHKEYRPVAKKPTASSSGNKKKCVVPTIEVSNLKGVAHTNEVSNSNSFEVLNSVDNDVELGTNGETTNLVTNEANSSGPSFMNVDNSSKFEDLLIDGQALLVDEAGNPLKNVEYPGDYDSEDEVASVDNDMARSMASEMVGFGTQSLLEQWRDSYGNSDYDEDPHDDDMYEGHDLPQEIQAICDNLDIRVRGRKKK
ncbi:retrotransposon protein, putative, ty1-copia subclass [Tanacetum coccineum]